ncbi:hypothetical protein HJG60_010729 [Phyllostomus discolor]|uniref:Uncharacterized protein n=1 Tax=Phyllostomus discolor TaxID=89673 RepID=A0A834ANS5_9CHIR|nr:hypothetical protein HJG60_010729 [Phyllostomus discolor]
MLDAAPATALFCLRDGHPCLQWAVCPGWGWVTLGRGHREWSEGSSEACPPPEAAGVLMSGKASRSEESQDGNVPSTATRAHTHRHTPRALALGAGVVQRSRDVSGAATLLLLPTAGCGFPGLSALWLPVP